jgi:hypothetical protein
MVTASLYISMKTNKETKQQPALKRLSKDQQVQNKRRKNQKNEDTSEEDNSFIEDDNETEPELEL